MGEYFNVFLIFLCLCKKGIHKGGLNERIPIADKKFDIY
jgi:hypothetical protein